MLIKAITFLLICLTFAKNHHCPIADSCPYYNKHSKDRGDCPLKGKNCPYYENHRNDNSEFDFMVTKDHICPLAAKKCSFYDDFKNGVKKEYNWENTACPLAKDCTYFKGLKDDKSHAKLHSCPILKGRSILVYQTDCPHFKKDGVDHLHKFDASKAKDCPHLKAAKPHTPDSFHHSYHHGDSSKCPHLVLLNS